MNTSEAVARAVELLIDGFAVSAGNMLLDNAKQASRLATCNLDTNTLPLDACRSRIIEALDMAIAQLQESREALRQWPLITPETSTGSSRAE